MTKTLLTQGERETRNNLAKPTNECYEKLYLADIKYKTKYKALNHSNS